MREDLKETLVELIENDQLSVTQMEHMLKYVQGNGYVEDGENHEFDDYDNHCG